ncbi:MAG: glycosyltransferase family 4 protein [Oscillochloris sp.]|nr:glycosyltransferase family 4 protein [Oscillochloris sp.]
MTKLLILSHDRVGSRMAGPGIRYWELARALASDLKITLAAPQPIDLTPTGFTTAHFADQAALAALTERADVVLANSFLLLNHPELAQIAAPLLLDLYDPTPLENLELFREHQPAERERQLQQDLTLLRAQLAAGDGFLCATERQRDLYIGALLAQGRLTPDQVDADPLLRNLIDVVSFGLPADRPQAAGAALRGILPQIDNETKLLLWTGGLWDWMDPLTLIRAMPALVQQIPQAKLVFLAGRHPGGAAAMRMPEQARALAAEIGLPGDVVQFYNEWVPYERRGDFLLEADLLVSLHRPGLESAYAAVRSRFLDHLWAGRASLMGDGDAAAELVVRHELGRVAPPQDVSATAERMIELLADDTLRAACAGRAAALAETYHWQRVAEPIRRFCAAPQRTRPAPHVPALLPVEEEPMTSERSFEDEQRDQIRTLEARWQLATVEQGGRGPGALLRRLLLRVLSPWLAEQREFNAALVRLFYLEQANTTRLNGLMAQVVSAHDRIGALNDFLSARVDDLATRTDALGTFDGELNDRVARLSYTVIQLNEAIAAADEAAAQLAAEIGALKAGEGASRNA